MRAVVVRFRVHWGISSRTPWGSVNQQSYYAPPPPTLLGALSAAAFDAGYTKIGEYYVSGGRIVQGGYWAYENLGVRWAAAAWLSMAVRTGVMIRYFTAVYQPTQQVLQNVLQAQRPVSDMWNPLEVSYVVSPLGELAITYLVDGGREKAVAELAWHVSRLGSKESLVQPIDVQACDLVEERPNRWAPLIFYAPRDCVEPDGNYVVERMPLPINRDEWACWFSVEPCTSTDRYSVIRNVVVPRAPGHARFKPRDVEGCGYYRLGCEAGEELGFLVVYSA